MNLIVRGPAGIAATRNNTSLFPNGMFTRPGDILTVPALSVQSPFLNTNINANAQIDHLDYDISDEMYEQIPQQLMGLVRLGSPRYVIYCYGQALRPADGGTVLSGNGFGLVTNYQVVAESAVRAVVQLHPNVQITFPNGPLNPPVTVTNYTTTVVNYSPLAPE